MIEYLPPSKPRCRPGDKPGIGITTRNVPWGTPFGSGTAEDPFIYWACRGQLDLSDDMIEAHNRIARETAILYSCRCVIIRAEAHNTQFMTVKETSTINGRTKDNYSKEIVPCDWHITVYMGKDLNNCYFEGHIYMVKDGATFRAATPADRKIVYPGWDRCAEELWRVKPEKKPEEETKTDTGTSKRPIPNVKGSASSAKASITASQPQKPIARANMFQVLDEHEKAVVVPKFVPAGDKTKQAKGGKYVPPHRREGQTGQLTHSTNGNWRTGMASQPSLPPVNLTQQPKEHISRG